MPIRPEFRKFYGPAWRETRERILKRAGNKCERCGKPNGAAIYTYTQPGTQPAMAWARRRGDDCWTNQDGRTEGGRWPAPGLPRMIRVVLAVGHLNHIPGDDRGENLQALCQWCHLHMDAPHHKDTRCARKDAVRPLLQQVAV